MESGDASDEEAHPCDPKSNNLMQKEWLRVISMLVDMETEDSLKRGAIMVVTKRIGLACADLLYHKTKNSFFLLCTPMVLIYNSELGVINSSEFFLCKETPEEALCTPLFYFLVRCGGRLPHEVVRNFGFYIHLGLCYKIHVFYMDCTLVTEKKCCEYYGPEGVKVIIGEVVNFKCWRNRSE